MVDFISLLGSLFPREKHLATVDHLIERRNGGTDEMCNLVAACRNCNNGRDAKGMTPEQYIILKAHQIMKWQRTK